MSLVLRHAEDVAFADFHSLGVDPYWNAGAEREHKLHRLHAYPAKFPAFITTKALAYAHANNIQVKRVADIFCGCGTVAFEAKRNDIDFWGCDISPVATLIAKAKSQGYSADKLRAYLQDILRHYKTSSAAVALSPEARERLRYWYPDTQRRDLAKLKNAIELAVPDRSHYRWVFLCVFSNILKPTSRWLTKSIKPQLDPNKKPASVRTTFELQCKALINAVEETDDFGSGDTTIVNANFLKVPPPAKKVDMLITSPPYVTSYEYADLHQLTSLWLGYVKNDYRELRTGSIGSSQLDFNFNREAKRLNDTGSNVVFRLFDRDKLAARATAKYFLDMQAVSDHCIRFLKHRSLAVFVIGDTEYKGVRIENARHLSESLLRSGFAAVNVAKRTISNKILTPNRDSVGRFSRHHAGKQVYGEEYVLIAQRA